MYRCLSLISLTEKGIREVSDSIERANRFCSAAEAAGGKVLGLYWAVGEADGAVILEAPDEQVAAQLLLSLGREGHVRTRTMRLYNAEEFQAVVQRV